MNSARVSASIWSETTNAKAAGASTKRSATAPGWVKALVLVHVFCVCAWACPKPSDALLSGRIKPSPLALGDWLRVFDEKYLKSLKLVQMYLFTTGTWQYWDMFAPNPADTDQYGDAVVHFKDGSVKVSQYPRMFLLSIPQKYLKERYRKFFERAHDVNNYPFMFIPFLYRTALDNDKDPNNPPVKIELRSYTRTIPPPGAREPADYTRTVYFVGEIDPRILSRLAKEER